MGNLQRYLFGLLGIFAIIGLVLVDKIYPVGQPVSERVYLIVGLFILGCIIGADNLTNIIQLIINKFTGKQ